MATQAQYDAGAKAAETIADKLIQERVPHLFQSAAYEALKAVLPEVVKAVIDAAEHAV